MRFVEQPIVGFDNGITITFRLPLSAKEELKDFFNAVDTLSLDEDYILSLAKAPKKRSLDANAYMWVLCDKIAKVIRGTKEEVYRRAIREVGVFSDVAVQEGEPCKQLVSSWSSYGIGYFAEVFNSSLKDNSGNEMKRVRLYQGSHKYLSKDLSRVIDYLVDEANNLGIQTISTTKIEELKSAWQG